MIYIIIFRNSCCRERVNLYSHGIGEANFFQVLNSKHCVIVRYLSLS